MKKTLCLLLALLLLLPLVGCEKEESTAARIWTLNGTTGFGMAPLMTAEAEKYTFTVEKDAANVRDALLSGEADIATLPTNVAASLYHATNGGIKVLALNTGGVLYVVGTDNAPTTLEGLAGRTLFVPAQNPYFITKALLDKAKIANVTLDSTTYATPEALRDAVADGLVELAVLPEPMVTIAQNAAAAAERTLTVALDLTAEWDKHFTKGSLVQGCVVVRTAFLNEHPALVREFLADYRAAIACVNQNPESAAAQIAAAGIFANAAVAAAAIPRCNILYLDGNEMKAALSAFLAEMPAASIGGELPDDDFYCVYHTETIID
ncbi:MAG: ABC transporter substrate-binding protein [Clostridia bacterium]|nr:ABC transporter substrate-binding protein [Clostridia bacterium]